ncbi:hypothetical protein [Actinoplanes sp. RD1]|uniref:hypothetical protein n=1 Tax=Actinoplanes sp. RD1 TaxID=3064538 RepID=UPI002741AC2A|nr:hypothetical protein [Actinoplanes sp. RD1]
MRRDWRDSARTAADLAVLGFLVTGAALPVVTAGAAVATGSAAIRHHLDHDTWPSPRSLGATFARSLLPGLGWSLALVAALALITIDFLAVRSGAAPGGPVALAALLVTALGVTGLAGLLAVTASPRAARRLARPGTLLASAGVVGLAGVLAVLVHPALVPVLAGYALFALHVVARRASSREPAPEPRPAPSRQPAVSPHPTVEAVGPRTLAGRPGAFARRTRRGVVAG